MRSSSYQSVRNDMRPGDIIAFGGEGLFSDLIKAFTFSPVSHAGIVMETKLTLEQGVQPGKIVSVLESTTLYKPKDGPVVKGVSQNRLSDRVDDYDGRMWWLPLRESIREQVDWKLFFDICWREKGKGYNMPQALLSALPFYQFFRPKDKKFCSQLVVYCLQQAGVKELRKINPANVNPQELCSMNLFAEEYVQIKGIEREIPRFNRFAPWLANF